MDTFIHTDHINFQYDADDAFGVLHDVCIDIRRGEFLALLGHNGCGKSTLAKLLNALNIPQKGEIWIDGVAAHKE